MGTFKMTGPDGMDYAFPERDPRFIHKKPPCPHVGKVPFPFWAFDDVPDYPEDDTDAVELPFRPKKPVPPYGCPKPERVDACSKKLAILSEKAKVLVQMIKDFEQKNKPAILTIGGHSYQLGTNRVTDFDGQPAAGMYSTLICGDPIESFEANEYETDDNHVRVALKQPVDILQSELARVRQEITLVAAALKQEVVEPNSGDTTGLLGTDEPASNP